VTAHYYVTSISFRDGRARNECLQLGLFIDAYLAMGLPEASDLLDLMCRRLVGVLQADEHGNWSLAAATQRGGASRLAGAELFAAMAKAAGSYDRVHKTVTRSGSTTAFGSQKTHRSRGKRGGINRGYGAGAGGNHYQPTDASAAGSAVAATAASGAGAARSARRQR
jgi:hypothetical protein